MSGRVAGLLVRNPGLPAIALRALLLAGCSVLALLGEQAGEDFSWIAAVGVVGAAVCVLERTALAGILGRTGEIVVWTIAVHSTGAELSPLLPYLLAPVFAGGLLTQATGALIAAGTGAAALLIGMSIPDEVAVKDYTVAAAQWTVIALMGGLVAAWARRLQEDVTEAESNAYDEAHRLLSELYRVTRQLPGSLDPATTAETLIEQVASIARFSTAAVVTRTQGERLAPLARRGTDRLDWDIAVTGDNAFARAWNLAEPLVENTMFAREANSLEPADPGSSLVVPIRIGERTTGVLALETEAEEAYDQALVAEIVNTAEELALRLETGLLFDSIRELATTEERRRLAREIHDGIAQELASLGYMVDEISATAADEGQPDIVEDLAGLRQEMTRIVRELRLSIFDLRSDVDRHGGLGAALSEYLRMIGTTSGFTVHLTLDESNRRLPAEVEAELLRIAQEAINNARKHAAADNLWVTCRVHPPDAELVVEDDGKGLGKGREDSYGLEVMRERAARSRAALEIRPRAPRGTYVAVRVGLPAAALASDPQDYDKLVQARATEGQHS
ncbi:MAG: GAF domain-containing sensor histidine kinase [Sporichthyaceae bacterium]